MMMETTTRHKLFFLLWAAIDSVNQARCCCLIGTDVCMQCLIVPSSDALRAFRSHAALDD